MTNMHEWLIMDVVERKGKEGREGLFLQKEGDRSTEIEKASERRRLSSVRGGCFDSEREAYTMSASHATRNFSYNNTLCVLVNGG